MKRIWLAGILGAMLPGLACAQGPIPDPWVPNNYVVTPAPGGGSNALGYDSRQWSYWQTQTDLRRDNIAAATATPTETNPDRNRRT